MANYKILLLLFIVATNQVNTEVCGHIVTILSIDGGGIRGIIPASILEYLEAELQVRSSNFSYIVYVCVFLCVRVYVCRFRYRVCSCMSDFLCLVDDEKLDDCTRIIIAICFLFNC